MTEHTSPLDRHHQHNLTGADVRWVQCATLTHCPSVCDCPLDGCTAHVTDAHRRTSRARLVTTASGMWPGLDPVERATMVTLLNTTTGMSMTGVRTMLTAGGW